MRGLAYLSLGVAVLAVSCGDSASFSHLNEEGAGSGQGGTALGGSAGKAGSADAGASEGGDANGSGGDAAMGGDGSAGTAGAANPGGSNTGGAGGVAGTSAGGLGGGGSAGTAGAGGVGGAPATCPGTQTGCVVDWAGQFGTSASASMDGVGPAAVFGGVDAVRALTGDGTFLYVAGSNCIRRIAIADATVETIVGQCGSSGFANQSGLQARFGAVDGLATFGGKLWVNDAGNFVVREIDLSDMSVSTLAGSAGNNGFQSGSAQTARFDHMLGMTAIQSNLFITEGADANTVNNDVRRIDTSSGAVSLIAGGNGTGAMNGAGNVASFSRPRKIGVIGTSLFVVDTENHRVRRIVVGNGGAATHVVSTLVGSTAGYMDATGTSAQLNRPRGISSDGTDLYLADSDNCVIRKITVPGAVVTTIAGTQLAGGCANHAVGVGAAAEFNKPMDLHFDPGSGDLFISEGSVIRRMYL